MQAQDRPRFRQDLIAELIEEGGARFIEVVAPDSNNYFRFYEVEYSIACAMDGQRDVAGIVKWATEELGVTPSPKEIQSVIATLADLRFIGEDKAAVAADAKVAKAAPTQPEKQPERQPEKQVEKQAAKQPDAELARGIVVGANVASRADAAPIDVELGASGAKAQPKAADLPKAPDFDLGAPGAPPVAAPPRAPVEDIALGAPGSRAEAPKAAKPPASDIGMDLSAHVGVGADDVKEAVRKSKAMTAVDVPKELIEAESPKATPAEKHPVAKQPEQQAKGSEKPGKGKSEAEKKAQSERDKAAAAEKKAAAAAKAEQDEKDKQAAKAAAVQPEAKKGPDKAADKKADKAPDKAADKKADKAKPAVELPKRPGTERPTAPAAGVSPVLVVLLILAIVGAGTFFVWKFLLSDPDATSQKQPKTPPKPLPPPPPADVTSKLAVETQTPQTVKALVAGTIETIEAADKDVKTGDVVATLAGGKPLTAEITNLTKQIEQAAPQIEAANKALEEAQQKPDNGPAVTAAQAKVDRLKKPLDEKKATVEKKKADVEKLLVKATADGKLTDVAKVGQKVAVDDTLASIARPSLMTASFKVPPGTRMTPDGNLSVVAGGKTIVCTVIDAQAETVKVACPADGLTAGADVKFTLPK